MTWEEAVVQAQDPGWRAKFKEISAVRKGEVPRNFTTQDAGSHTVVGSRVEISYNILSKVPDMPT